MTSHSDEKKEIVKPPDTSGVPSNDSTKNEHVEDALAAAEKDIAADADLSLHSPNDDLDEGGLARLGEDKNDLT